MVLHTVCKLSLKNCKHDYAWSLSRKGKLILEKGIARNIGATSFKGPG